MTTNKPEVFYANRLYMSDYIARVMRRIAERTEPVVRLSDYERLQAECEKLRSIISDIKDWDCDVSGGFLSIPLYLRRRMQEAVDRARRIEGERE